MIWYKKCRRCGGDLVQGSDLHGEYISCMQCGSILNDKEQRTLTGAMTTKPSNYSQILATRPGPNEECNPARAVRRAT